MRSQVGGEVVEELIEIFLDDSVRSFAALERAVGETDYHAMAACAHALRGSVSNFHASGALSLCDEIEHYAQARNGTKEIDVRLVRLRAAIGTLQTVLANERSRVP